MKKKNLSARSSAGLRLLAVGQKLWAEMGRGEMSVVPIPATMPAKIEVCTRQFNDGLCLGVIYRPQPETIVCPRCGGSEPGVVYVRKGLASNLSRPQ